ncbi:MAG: hypothetical protein OXN17_20055 [Candidatus Poribacteria bacterium]|nr:hypothetical protein [Candidatus Poribacteria bacterium]MDE0506290.1 hypothetical protein [Candidatus Poribacteria bacterium]
MLSQIRRHHWAALIVTMSMAAIVASPLYAAQQVKWEKSLKAGMEKAKEAGKPMIIDFFTEW